MKSLFEKRHGPFTFILHVKIEAPSGGIVKDVEVVTGLSIVWIIMKNPPCKAEFYIVIEGKFRGY